MRLIVTLCVHCLSCFLLGSIPLVLWPNVAFKRLALLTRVWRYRTQTSDRTPDILHENHRGFPQPVQTPAEQCCRLCYDRVTEHSLQFSFLCLSHYSTQHYSAYLKSVVTRTKPPSSFLYEFAFFFLLSSLFCTVFGLLPPCYKLLVREADLCCVVIV